MPKKTISLPFCALCSVVLFILLILARCHGTRPAAEETAAAEKAVPVLMYHHLLKQAENTRYRGNDIVTYVEDFEAQLAWLHKNGFQSITTAQLDAYLYENGALPSKPVLFTFDDGYLSNFVYAYPLLKQYGYTAVIFSVTGKIAEAPADFKPTLVQMLDGETMQQCAPVFEFASHTHSLHTTSGGGRSALTDAGESEIRRDLRESLRVLAAYPGSTASVFSYPYGFYNDKVAGVLKQEGVRLAFRATGGRLTRQSDPYSLPRYAVSYRVSLEEFQAFFSEYDAAP